MKFSNFMREWLYGKNGYYTNYEEIGKEGDFYTAVSSSIFFGGSIAKRLISTIKEGFLPKDCTVLEIGAHKGYLLADMIQFIYTIEPKLLESLKFAILEPQENLRISQENYFKNSFSDSIELTFYKKFDELSLSSAFVVANEIFDAFPCEVVNDKNMLYMDNFKPYFDIQVSEIRDLSQKYNIKRGEISIGYEKFANDLKKSIERFEFVTFDYGEKYSRGDFSLRIYDKHQVYPFFALTKFAKDEKLEKKGVTIENLFQKSDITYDVNFAHLFDSFSYSDIKTVSYMTQLKALVQFGIIDLLEILRKNSSEKQYIQELNKVKYLIDPSFMGERFKCVIFRKI